MPKSTGEIWMGAPEAAEYLGITVRTLYKLVNDGDIRAYRVGRGLSLCRGGLQLSTT